MHWNKRGPWTGMMAGLLLVSALAGCKPDDATVYHVTKDEASPPAQTTPDMAPTNAQPEMNAPMETGPAFPPIKYQLPQGWQEKAPTEMRVASFNAPGPDGQSADVSVIPLPVVGHDLDLVNMWRSRVQLPATSDPDAVNEAKPVSIGNDQGRLFEFVSEQPMIGKSRQRLLVAMLTRGATSWFFKITGEDAFVNSQKEKFLQFLKSISFGDDAPGQTTANPTTLNENFIQTPPAGRQQKCDFTKFIPSANYANAR